MNIVIPDGVAVSPALEALGLAHLTPAGWASVAFGVAWTLFCAAMLYAFISNDSRPTLNERCASEVEEARR